MTRMREESSKHKEVELRRAREIAQLRKETRRRDNQIRSLEAEKRAKEVLRFIQYSCFVLFKI